MHVVSSSKFALKAQEAGCDAVVAEGFEAGGHNGREDTTSFVLIPLVKEAVNIPVIAAGGIATGKQMFAAMALGADAVQIGSRYVASDEASCHDDFKSLVVNSGEGATELSLKKLTPVRLLKNEFYREIVALQDANSSKEELEKHLGRGRATSVDLANRSLSKTIEQFSINNTEIYALYLLIFFLINLAL